MTASLDGKSVAILATSWFEQAELMEPRKALEDAGATVHVIAPEGGAIQGAHHDKPGDKVAVDRPLAEAGPQEYDALVLPGGVFSPDQLRMQEPALAFIRHFVEAGKPVGAICHAPWLLISAGVVHGRTMTSYPSVRLDLANAGAQVVDREVVVDGNLVTSRAPGDLPAFNAKLVELIGRTKARPA